MQPIGPIGSEFDVNKEALRDCLSKSLGKTWLEAMEPICMQTKNL